MIHQAQKSLIRKKSFILYRLLYHHQISIDSRAGTYGRVSYLTVTHLSLRQADSQA
jgi:hypothetical protein